MSDPISRILSAIGYALTFIAPPLLLTLIAALLFAWLLWLINDRWKPVAPPANPGEPAPSTPNNPSFGEILRLAIGFGGFGYVEGFFLAISNQLLVISISGTVSSAGMTYLALLYGKDAIQSSSRILTAALLTFFLSLAITLEYTRSYLGLAGG